ncbi:hypothetical protein PRIPAC_77881, partial [Pristionchus pacificus]|uniref:G protein-coupled receptor n=1 Tax=Pristionchus pacificus TaxID=54126 RepID=A0A2A6CLD2_PRIPA
MAHKEYVDPLVNEITYAVQVLVTVVAYILNLLLLYIIFKSTRRDIGTYRILLTYFAVSDLYYNTLHFSVYPIPEMHGNAFMMRGHGIYPELLGVGLYLGAYGHAFPILIFHFLYRLVAIKYPHWLKHFPVFFGALILSTVACNLLMFSIFYWFFHPDEQSLRILGPIFNGTIPQDVVHTPDTAAEHAQALYWDSSYSRCDCRGNIFENSSAMKIKAVISVRKQMKSALSMRLHKQLFRSLIYQAFVPLFTAYYPAGTSVMLPIFGITIPYISIIVPPACATHPLVDPLVLMLTINEYRQTRLLPTHGTIPSGSIDHCGRQIEDYCYENIEHHNEVSGERRNGRCPRKLQKTMNVYVPVIVEQINDTPTRFLHRGPLKVPFVCN